MSNDRIVTAAGSKSARAHNLGLKPNRWVFGYKQLSVLMEYMISLTLNKLEDGRAVIATSAQLLGLPIEIDPKHEGDDFILLVEI